ncbi:MAG: EamA family transporter [Treponema sp.]|jgi:transporter family protein|nr:EamA family transporter [Treponema sp.]
MYIVFALASAVFSALTTVLSKLGLKNINSHVATFFRTGVVLVFVWLIVLATGVYSPITALSTKTLLFLVLSGIAGGASWLCYFRALQLGSINKVVAVDKSGIILTMLMGMIFLAESAGALKIIALVVIAAGTYLMLEPKEEENRIVQSRWFLYAAGSAVFASLSSIFAKIGMGTIDSNLGTALRTSIIFVFAGLMVPISGSAGTIGTIKKRELLFLGLSGVATGLAWLCYFRALRLGEASVVAPLDKLSIVFTVLLSRLIFRERVSPKTIVGLSLLTAGTLLLL